MTAQATLFNAAEVISDVAPAAGVGQPAHAPSARRTAHAAIPNRVRPGDAPGAFQRP